MRAFETVAVILTLLGVGASVGAPFAYERSRRARAASDVDRVITLTGIAEAGLWTEEAVHGGNYWNREFSQARITMRPGEKVLLILKSADVIHHFYSPALGIGPVKVYPRRVTEATIHAEKAGTYAC